MAYIVLDVNALDMRIPETWVGTYIPTICY